MCHVPPCKPSTTNKTNQKKQMAYSSFAQMFDEILRREVMSVMSRIAEGEGLNMDYLVSTYFPKDIAPAMPEKPEKKTRPAKVSVSHESEPVTNCTAVTAKGKPCSLKALAGKCVCRIHDKAPAEPKTPKSKKPAVSDDGAGPSSPPKAPKKKAKKSKKKEQPEHTHEVDDTVHDDCELCQSHGSPLEDTDVEEEFETVMSPPRTLRERLAKVALEAETYDEDEEE